MQKWHELQLGSSPKCAPSDSEKFIFQGGKKYPALEYGSMPWDAIKPYSRVGGSRAKKNSVPGIGCRIGRQKVEKGHFFVP